MRSRKFCLTPQRTLNAGIVGKSAKHHRESCRHLHSRRNAVSCWPIVRGVGRDYPWSIEKLSPTLAFFVVDGVEQGANRCQEILQFGGMGHTAGMHSRTARPRSTMASKCRRPV